MSSTLERIAGPQAIAAGASVIYTTPADTRVTIRFIKIINTTSGDVELTAFGINGVADADLELPSELLLGAKESMEFGGVLSLAGGDTIEADVDGTGLTITISGLVQSS